MALKDSMIIFLKGLCMGSADIIPGVSGGTIALITGIYERLIFGIRNIEVRSILLNLLIGNFRKVMDDIKKIDFPFFIPLLSGIGLAFLILSKVIKFFLEEFTAFTYAFFFGLIFASAFVVYKHVDKLNFKNIFFSILGFVFAFLFVGLGVLKAQHSLPTIFSSGAIAICAMILPGISGAFILVFLNQYEHMLDALNNLKFLEIFTFIFGAFLGIVTFSRILSFLLKHYKSLTMSFLVGLMLGALRLPYEYVIENINMNSLPFVLVSALLGFFIVFIVETRFR
jgi:putative membrane protein